MPPLNSIHCAALKKHIHCMYAMELNPFSSPLFLIFGIGAADPVDTVFLFCFCSQNCTDCEITICSSRLEDSVIQCENAMYESEISMSLNVAEFRSWIISVRGIIHFERCEICLIVSADPPHFCP
ncbi:hypothetical protein Nepgr_002033 [Nepenthes gracilis]|uniref:Uncharacterized protein n=1 Tax=Nepenthes gracilis TaxID=150966 RepID=A0AAD3P5I2_NEPGR|nr:hypothetical protein Nepgr_002033 [Nepenthes gracilis]